MYGLHRFRRVALCAVCAAGIALLGGSAARSASTSHLTLLYVNEDSFRNYDFLSQTVSASNVDWPVTLLFYNNANVNKAKIFAWTGSTMYGRMNDGTGYVWDSDKGSKDSLCPIVGDAHHYRVYAPPTTDRLYNVTWGYWVFATSHIDHNECGFGSYSGYPDRTEDYVATQFANAGYQVERNWASFSNPEPYRVEGGDHIWSNDGYATRIRIP
jgi:hypothetical protein